MKRKYVLLVLMLLSISVISTLGLSYTQTSLMENWDTIYTLQYGLSDLTLHEPTNTELGSTDGDLTVTIPASSTVAVTPKITVEPLDASGLVISTDDAGTYEISVSLRDATHAEIETKIITITVSGSETEISGTATFTVSTDQIAEIVINFNCPGATGFGSGDSEAFETVYENLRLTIEDA